MRGSPPGPARFCGLSGNPRCPPARTPSNLKGSALAARAPSSIASAARARLFVVQALSESCICVLHGSVHDSIGCPLQVSRCPHIVPVGCTAALARTQSAHDRTRLWGPCFSRLGRVERLQPAVANAAPRSLHTPRSLRPARCTRRTLCALLAASLTRSALRAPHCLSWLPAQVASIDAGL